VGRSGARFSRVGHAAMAKVGLFRRLWLTRLSKPAVERLIYRTVLQAKPRRILELGLGTLKRSERVLTVARAVSDGAVHYVGLDRFEGRLPTDPPGVTLKQAHQRLHALAKVQLVPGNADGSLARLCNHLGVFDLVLVSADNDPRHLERIWFFIQRLVNDQTTVLVEHEAGAWKRVAKDRIDELAARTVLKRAA
jgi:hypothetical protein